MSDIEKPEVPSCSASVGYAASSPLSAQVKLLGILALLLVICFARPLCDLVCYAVRSDLFSHVLVIPFISAYFVVLKKPGLRVGTSPPRKWAAVSVAASLAALLCYWLGNLAGVNLSRTDYLTWTILAFFLLFLAACQFSLARETLWDLAFPIAFLIFIVPFPSWLTARLETLLQYSSAMAAHALFALTAMPVMREGLRFQLPGMQLEVAPECSGIHSTLVLFITAVLAGHLFLCSSWRRATLWLVVIPLGILRNAVRICIIGQLCVHIGPHMINSPIHRRGGPLFFVAALVPFFALLWWLRKSEGKSQVCTNQK